MVRQVDADVIIVGAGFAGLYAAHKLNRDGFSVLGIEKAPDIGGTWYWNCYPGARCDVESLEYSYSFSDELEQEWNWTERYASQPEILSYIRHVADKYAIQRHFRFGQAVMRAKFIDGLWQVETDQGETLSSHYLVMATGCLSVPLFPDIEGLDRFAGRKLHTGQWPQEGVDFRGRTVGIIGTGSSAIQCMPEVAKQAKQVLVFQRTPHFSVPARNAPLSAEAIAQWRADYPRLRESAKSSRSAVNFEYSDALAVEASADERDAEFRRRWAGGGANFMHAFADLGRSEEANHHAAQFVRDRIAEIVTDPATAQKLTPTTYPIGTKRICVDTDYYATYNRPNVALVDVQADPICSFTETGLDTKDAAYRFDDIIFGTGFDAMTGALLRVDIVGKDGRALRDAWTDGPRTYLGLAIAGFPNLFIVTGPGSPSVFTNMVMSVEHHVEWISEALGWMRERGHQTIEAKKDAQDDWVARVNRLADATLYSKGTSWYNGANVGGKSRVFMPFLGGFGNYTAKCRAIADAGYTGFTIG